MQPAANREIELKFLVGATDISHLGTLPALEAASSNAQCDHISTTYFDTPDRDLWKKGFSLRIRKAGDRFVETIKLETASLIARGEWETETSSATLDLSCAEKTPLAALVGKHRIRTELRPAFEVTLDRCVFSSARNGAEIECVIDDGQIEADGRTLPVRELELELKSGDRWALFDLARSLSAEAPLRLSLISKAERGYRLAAGTWGRAEKGSEPRLHAEMTCRQAIQEIARTCLHDLMLNSAALEGPDYVEGVHQARVAIRRLRAALALFKPVIADAVFPALSNELKWLAGLLGTARDLDVMQVEGPASPQYAPHAAANGEVEARRTAAHQAVRDGFTSARYQTFLVDFVAWIETGSWQAQKAVRAETKVDDFVARRLRKRRRRLVAAGEDLAELDPVARHRIRVDAKKLRYMMEFFRTLPSVTARRKSYKALVMALADLQQALGDIHDIEVRESLLADALATVAGGDRAEAAAGYLEAAATDTSKELAGAIDAYRRLVAAKPF